MKTKRLLARLALALVSLSILSACASSGAKGQEQFKLPVAAPHSDGYAETEFEKWKFED